MDQSLYYVHFEPLVIDLEPIYSFCFFERVHLLQASTMILPDGSEVSLATEQALNDRGIHIVQGNMTSTLHVFSDDETLYDH